MRESNGKTRFFAALSGYGRFSHCWDRQKGFDEELFEIALSTMSSGEAHMARFFAGIWLQENTYEFDLFEAIFVINEEDEDLIANWIKNPIRL